MVRLQIAAWHHSGRMRSFIRARCDAAFRSARGTVLRDAAFRTYPTASGRCESVRMERLDEFPDRATRYHLCRAVLSSPIRRQKGDPCS